MIRDEFKPVVMSFEELNQHFENFANELSSKREDTKGTYTRALREFLKWFAVDKKFRFLVEDVQRYRDYLTHIKKLSPVSVSTYLTALRRFCEYLKTIGVIEKNPAKRIPGNKRPTSHSREFLTWEEIDMLLSSVERKDEAGYRDYAMIKMMLGCAMSELELSNADVGDLKVVNNQYIIYVQGKGKDVKDEAVPVPDDVVKALHDYFTIRSKRQPVEPDQPMFVSLGPKSMGERLTNKGIRIIISEYLKKSGVKKGRNRKLTPYSLKHTAAMIMVENGATPEELKKRLRLGSIETAMIYFRQKGKLGKPPQKQDSIQLSLL
ncbi:tyrosine-type recombinase/integrase [Candidatus Chrysopegis kryptomonas]|uniref:Integrase/recombinase XerC n=1 Tax=Candidatus Chryseopegocella kryptomonas TaxID=1633643 RepID=A0A0P1P1E4_9BACT|nr:tyrosine-type recombinase/integrase [Candidatus Chrysopegis kryptomonas]CUT04505.1 integrase/recombinase XerC [Candidatus Chrysopegis kryptomonas]